MLYSVKSPILRGCLVMADISGEDRSQVLLLPDAVIVIQADCTCKWP